MKLDYTGNNSCYKVRIWFQKYSPFQIKRLSTNKKELNFTPLKTVEIRKRQKKSWTQSSKKWDWLAQLTEIFHYWADFYGNFSSEQDNSKNIRTVEYGIIWFLFISNSPIEIQKRSNNESYTSFFEPYITIYSVISSFSTTIGVESFFKKHFRWING